MSRSLLPRTWSPSKNRRQVFTEGRRRCHFPMRLGTVPAGVGLQARSTENRWQGPRPQTRDPASGGAAGESQPGVALPKHGTGLGPSVSLPGTQPRGPQGSGSWGLFPRWAPGVRTLERGLLQPQSPARYRPLQGAVCPLPPGCLPLTPTPSRMRVKEPTDSSAPDPPKPAPGPGLWPPRTGPRLCAAPFLPVSPDGLATPGSDPDLGP